MPPEKSFGESKKINNWGRIFFRWQIAYKRMAQNTTILCTTAPIFFCSLRLEITYSPLLSKAYLQLEEVNGLKSPFPGIFKVVQFCLQQFEKIFCSLRSQIICTSTLNLFHCSCLSIISAACTEFGQLILRKKLKLLPPNVIFYG